jgi:hypothetical protein
MEFSSHIWINRAKRYERMMRSHGIAPNAASIKPAPGRVVKTECRKSSTASKKRKADAFVQDNTTADDDETFANVKPEAAESKEHLQVKEEGDDLLSIGDAANLVQYYDTTSQYGGEKPSREQDYNGSEYGGSTIAYATPLSSDYGLQNQQTYGFGASYGPGGMESTTRYAAESDHRQSSLPPMVLWRVGSQGHSDSPVVLE